jgi:hypothetical protein
MNNKEFICNLKKCRLYLENPIILPCCGSTICNEHENDFEIKDEDKFKCPICKKHETIPQNGFQINRKIMNSIDNGDHLGELQKYMSNSIAKLESKLKEHKSFNSEEIIFDYFSNLRNQVDLHREQKIEQIKKELKEKISDQIIQQIHLKSEEVLSFFKKEEEKFKENAKNIKLDDFNAPGLSLWKNRLREPDFKEEEAQILYFHINDKIREIDNYISKYKNDCLMNKKIEFVPSKLDHFFGEIVILKNKFKISIYKYLYSLYRYE